MNTDTDRINALNRLISDDGYFEVTLRWNNYQDRVMIYDGSGCVWADVSVPDEAEEGDDEGITLRLAIDALQEAKAGHPIFKLEHTIHTAEDENGRLLEQVAKATARIKELEGALDACDSAFVSWQVGQIPGRPSDILALIHRVRTVLHPNPAQG